MQTIRSCISRGCNNLGQYSLYCIDHTHLHLDKSEDVISYCIKRGIGLHFVIDGSDIASPDLVGKSFLVTNVGIIAYTPSIGYRLVYTMFGNASTDMVLCVGDCYNLCKRKDNVCSQLSIDKYGKHFIDLYQLINNRYRHLFHKISTDIAILSTTLTPSTMTSTIGSVCENLKDLMVRHMIAHSIESFNKAYSTPGGPVQEYLDRNDFERIYREAKMNGLYDAKSKDAKLATIISDTTCGYVTNSPRSSSSKCDNPTLPLCRYCSNHVAEVLKHTTLVSYINDKFKGIGSCGLVYTESSIQYNEYGIMEKIPGAVHLDNSKNHVLFDALTPKSGANAKIVDRVSCEKIGTGSNISKISDYLNKFVPSIGILCTKYPDTYNGSGIYVGYIFAHIANVGMGIVARFEMSAEVMNDRLQEIANGTPLIENRSFIASIRDTLRFANGDLGRFIHEHQCSNLEYEFLSKHYLNLYQIFDSEVKGSSGGSTTRGIDSNLKLTPAVKNAIGRAWSNVATDIVVGSFPFILELYMVICTKMCHVVDANGYSNVMSVHT